MENYFKINACLRILEMLAGNFTKKITKITNKLLTSFYINIAYGYPVHP